MSKRIYKRKPEYCTKYTKELLEPLAKQLLTSKEIGKIVGTTAGYIGKLRRQYNLPRNKNGDWQKMENNPAWKGGRITDKGGYILIKMNNHPFCNSLGYIREHRFVMENYLKRYLLKTEVVHHKDGKHGNNKLSNLELFQSNGKHLKKELTGKIPKWTPLGKKKILIAVRQPRKKKVFSNHL